MKHSIMFFSKESFRSGKDHVAFKAVFLFAVGTGPDKNIGMGTAVAKERRSILGFTTPVVTLSHLEDFFTAAKTDSAKARSKLGKVEILLAP
jgi:hypothetical protein